MAWTKEQEKAINESGSNIIVSAGAGSGKTAVLTARTMRIINSGTHVNELLILTFTKAAAAEMKERIRASIKENSLTKKELKKELELIDQAYITTFDSFALSIVKKYHYLLNISKNISITDSSIIDMQKKIILDETFAEEYQNPSSQFTKLISDFCVKDDEDLKKCILNIAIKIDGLPNRDEYLTNYLKTYYSDNFIKDCLTEYQNILLTKLAEIADNTYNLTMLTDQKYSDKLAENLTNLLNATNIDEIYNQCAVLSSLPILRNADEETKKCKETLKNSIDELKEISLNYGTLEEIKENIELTFTYIEAILNIIKKFLTKFHQYKQENEIYDFQDIALLSIRILKENIAVCEELKNTFKEIMIDEYQDTNDIQETFISMIENNNVYMVGDIKQSIYRFRNANPYIFKNKYDNYSQGKKGIKIDLVKNFRSRQEVLSNINEIFNLLMDDDIGGAEYHDSHQMVFGNTSYIEEGLTDYNYNLKIMEYSLPEDKKYSKEEIEIFTIAKDIQNKIKNQYQVFDKSKKILRNINYSDIVILMDRTTDFDLYKKIFEYLKIPLTLYKDEKLNNSDDIYILKNIIDYIIKIKENNYNQEFKYDFISIARSYLFKLDDNFIFECFKKNDFKNNIIYETLAPLSNNLNSKTITDLLNEIIAACNIYEKLITVGNIDASMMRLSKIIDIAKNLSDIGYDIYSFNEYLKELLSSNYDLKFSTTISNSDSVKIMTIHKSKGLEYHICYYSGLYKTFNISDLKERFLLDTNYGIICPYFKGGIKETIIKFLVKYHFLQEEVSEKIRLFYVALTRAKETMILLTPKVEEENYPLKNNGVINNALRRSYRSFSQMLTSTKSRLAKYYHEINLDNINLTKEYLFTNKNLDKINSYATNSFTVNEIPIIDNKLEEKNHFSKTLNKLIDKEQYNNLKFGLEVHETLEYIDFLNPQYDLIDNKFVQNKVKNFISQLKNLDKCEIYKEYEFIYKEANKEYHGIIDLILEYQEVIQIIDYKLKNIDDPNYLKQLDGYKNYLQKISNKKVEIYLYSIMTGELKEL